MKSYQLAHEERERGFPEAEVGFGARALLHNALWFTRIRWIIVMIFAAGGVVGRLLPEHVLVTTRVVPPGAVSWILCGVLAAANLALVGVLKGLTAQSARGTIRLHIWAQILVDLTVLTYYVHLVGCCSFVAFTYLFHIALACIFFRPCVSFLVTCFAVILYGSCLLPVWFTVPDGPVVPSGDGDPAVTTLFVLGTIGIWFVVWYLVSTLSQGVRLRDAKLEAANRQLKDADDDKNRLVLRTTHDLKAPFSGMQTNIQLLRYRYWDDLPEAVRKVLAKIETQAATLSTRISGILQLGALRSDTGMHADGASAHTGLVPLLEEVVREVSEKAMSRNVTIELDAADAVVVGSELSLHMLFANLVANAVFYSKEGGRVEISSWELGPHVTVCVTDHGIGIREDALPHIFEEYYRTKEGADFNRQSTGLGLSIVKEVVARLKLGLQVSSALGEGTTFEVQMTKYAPSTACASGADAEEEDGV